MTSPNTASPARAQQIAMLRTLIGGLTKHKSALPLLALQGKQYQATDLITAFQARLDATNAVVPAHAAWIKAVDADQTERENTDVLLSGTKQALLLAYAGQADMLADFGLVARKPSVVSPATRVAAAQKAKATRAARHTMGKKQKAAITGDASTAPVIASPTAGAAPAPPSATPPSSAATVASKS